MPSKKETTREAWRWRWVADLVDDVRYGVRTLCGKPSFTAVAVVTLALGIGANTAIFSVIHGVLLEPLPYKSSERILEVHSGNEAFKGLSLGVALGDVARVKKEVRSLQEVTVYHTSGRNLTGEGEPQAIEAAQVASEFFDFLGTATTLGRFFAEGEHSPGNERVAVLSDSLWRTRFGGEQNVLGKNIRLDGKDYRIVGVARAGFEFPSRDTAVWLPMAPTPQEAQDHTSHGHQALARLRVGATLPQANSELKALAERIENENKDGFGGWTMSAVKLQESTVEKTRPALLILFGAVTLVLLIACANVANLLLSRGWQRHKEMALRAALGASRWRIARLLLTESVLLATVGGMLGLALASWGVKVFRQLAPAGTPRIEHLHPDWTMAGFALACAVLVGIVFGSLPAMQAAGWDPNSALKETGTGAAPGRQRLRDGLAVLEIAMALPLLVGSGLLLRGLSSLTHTSTGFRMDHLVMMFMKLPEAKYPKEIELVTFVRQVLEQVHGVAGVEDAAISNSLPLSGSLAVYAGLQIEGQPELPKGIGNIQTSSVSCDYFRTMGIPILRGREFTKRDDANAAKIAIVNQTMARELWHGRDPIGTRISSGKGNEETRWIVVGIVGDTRDVNLSKPARAELYYPIEQVPTLRLSLLVRGKQDPEKLVPALRERIWNVDKEQPITQIHTMEAMVARSVAEPRFRTALLGAFAGLGTILALVGIYGVVSYAVSTRTREIGVRVAMGAQTNDVITLVIGHGLRIAATGIGIGLAAALALTKFLQALLYGVSPRDPWTFAGVAVILAGAAIAACWIPARRAMRVDPMVALRYE